MEIDGFRDKLQQLAVQSGYAAGLELNGKIDREKAYKKVKKLWKKLKKEYVASRT